MSGKIKNVVQEEGCRRYAQDKTKVGVRQPYRGMGAICMARRGVQPEVGAASGQGEGGQNRLDERSGAWTKRAKAAAMMGRVHLHLRVHEPKAGVVGSIRS